MSYSAKPQRKNLFPIAKILFIIACFYLGLVISWLISQGKLKLPGMTHQTQTTNQIQQLSQSDLEFIAYLQQSLDVIDRQTQTAKQTNSNTIPTTVISVPPPPSTANNTTRIVERIYVPVYPQDSSSVLIQENSSLPPPSVTTSPVIPTKPTTVPVLTPRETVISTAPSPVLTNNTLVGVLESGAQSSALFNNNGITQRIAIGEEINGWKLVSVQNQQAILERNGKQQILEVGRSF